VKPWLAYLIVRLGLFGVALTVLLLLGITPWIAALIAAVIGMSLAYIFFRPLRERLIDSVRTANPHADSDDEHAEDASA
jgi:Flp pilus assembly protein TadB